MKGLVAGISCSGRRLTISLAFDLEQMSHSVVEGALSSFWISAPLTLLGSCAIAAGLAWLRILCHVFESAPIGFLGSTEALNLRCSEANTELV